MRIAIDATALFGRYGGVEYSLWNLLCALHAEDSDNEYRLYIPRDGPPRDRLLKFNSRWRWLRLPFYGAQKLRRIVWQQKVLPSLLTRNKCDILHSPTYVAPLNSPTPTVLTVYDLIALSHPQFATRLNRLHYGQMLPRSIARAARVVAPTPAVASQIGKRFPEASDRIRVVPLGVEPIFLQPPSEQALIQSRAHYDLPEKYLLFVGNFEPKKNLQTVLRAMELLPHAPTLIIAGGNRAWPEYVLQNTSSVRFIGYVPRAELPALYAGCAAFIFPSLAEGFGLPVLEALACGAPVVTSPAVPLPQLENAALLCDPHDPASLAAAINRVLSEPEEAARLKAVGKEYAQPFTWRRTARETLAIYHEVGTGGRTIFDAGIPARTERHRVNKAATEGPQ